MSENLEMCRFAIYGMECKVDAEIDELMRYKTPDAINNLLEIMDVIKENCKEAFQEEKRMEGDWDRIDKQLTRALKSTTFWKKEEGKRSFAR